MKLIQPLLVLLLFAFVVLYFARFRSRLLDRAIVVLFAGFGMCMVAVPDLAQTIANFLGVGRGADLVNYLGLAGLSFMWLLMYSSLRELKLQVTHLVRTIAINNVHKHEKADSEEQDQHSN